MAFTLTSHSYIIGTLFVVIVYLTFKTTAVTTTKTETTQPPSSTTTQSPTSTTTTTQQSSSTTTTTPKAIEIGQECPENTTDISCKDPNASCQTNGEDTTGKCRCHDDFYSNGTICLNKIDNGKECPEHNTNISCKDPNASCQTTGNDTTRECRCHDDFYSNDTVCLHKIEIGKDCPENTTDISCKDPNASCQTNGEDTTGKCRCHDDFYSNGTICLNKIEIGKECPEHNTNISCKDPNASCRTNGEDTSGECRCHDDFYSNGTVCLQKIKYQEQCNENEPDEFCLTKNASCINQTCVCNSSRHYVITEDLCHIRPNLPSDDNLNIYEYNIKQHEFTIIWNDGVQLGLKISVKINPRNNVNQTDFLSQGDGRNLIVVQNLNSGTSYLVSIGVEKDGIMSEFTHDRKIITQPEALIGDERKILNVTESSFIVILEPNNNKNCDKYLLRITAPNAQEISWTLFRNISKLSHKFSGLNESTLYTLSITVFAGNWTNNKTESLMIYTLPRTITHAEVAVRTRSSLMITAHYDGPNSEKISYAVTLKDFQENNILKTTCKDESENKNITIFTNSTIKIINLNAGSQYIMDIYSCLEKQSSNHPLTLSAFTRPETPTVEFICWTETSLNVKWIINQDIKENVTLCIRLQLDPDVFNTSCLLKDTSGNHTFRNLSGGNHYTVTASSYIKANENNENKTIYSGGNSSASHYTNPPPPHRSSLIFDAIGTQSFEISIKNETWHKYKFEVFPSSTNNISNIETSEFPVEITNLEIGTKYNITVYSFVDDIRSERFTVISSYTRPDTVRDIIANFSISNATALTIQWKEPKDGSYNSFEINATCESPNKETDMNSSFFKTSTTTSTTLTSLDPGTFCNVTVYTVINNSEGSDLLSGGSSKVLENSTDELAPNQVHNVRTFTSATSLTLEWQKPLIPNGVIRQYMTFIIDEKYNCTAFQMSDICERKGCQNILNFSGCEGKDSHVPMMCNYSTSTDSNTTIVNGIFRQVTSGLHPYRKYSVSIQGYTKCWGELLNRLFQTNITVPSKPPMEISPTYTNPTSIELSWNSLNGTDDANGPIIHYTIFKSYSNRLNCSSNLGTNVTKSYSSITNSFTLDNLWPYWNYSVSVSASTKAGTGPQSTEITYTTNETKPGPISSSTIVIKPGRRHANISWSLPCLQNGKITKYEIFINNTECIDCSNISLDGLNITTVDKLHTVVSYLKPYRKYTVRVKAFTSAGPGDFSVIKEFQTDIDAPGSVTNVTLVPESNVTKPRTLQISWNKPMEPNGILTAYFVICTNQNDTTEIYHSKMETNATSYFVKRMQPGIYIVQVFAATTIGPGINVSSIIKIQPGAPIKKINETPGSLLMQPSDEQPPDKKTQIAIELPLEGLLCDTSNGDLKRWGVIVAQDEQANDKPFLGSTDDFKTKEAQYKNWFDVKDMDSIPPYIATPKDWNVNCVGVHEGNRRKRETSHQSDNSRFIVGSSGQCEGVQQNDYCNGELQPGRNYRVKSFACTEGGCTETEYSEPLSTVQRTKSDQDFTIAIATGLSAAVVVIAIAAVVIFILRRKQLACFTKDDESLRTHTPGEGIHLDKMESKKKNHFRQGPIKLSDFPAAVEKFHNDSDLLFADAYKMLKEKSPSHPMTAAEQQCCRPKNRYTNILPFDHSRVKLRPSDDMEGSDYINANYIPGYTSRREYIATQGPMLATIDDFWRMVWEQNVDTIVMLTKLMEKGRHKCDKYWPDLGEPVFYGDLVVSLQSESNLSDYTIMIFEIKMKEEQKTVRHFSYLKWPDMGCPETPEFLLEFVKAVKQYGNREKKPTSGPTIVHCSAGVGRTGTFIAVDYLLQHIRDHDEVDIFNLVLDMRNHRLNMVQTEDQYIYIHECVKAFITTDEEEEEDDEAIYVNTGFGADEEESIYVNA